MMIWHGFHMASVRFVMDLLHFLHGSFGDKPCWIDAAVRPNCRLVQVGEADTLASETIQILSSW